MNKYNLAFLSSHGGSNMQAIIDACRNRELEMNPALIISNNSGSKALERAKYENIPFCHLSSTTHPDPEEFDRAMKDVLTEYDITLIILAGYMKKIGPQVLSAWSSRILNIHPALLPDYGGQGMYGLNVHKAVIANHEEFTGITVHLVDEKYDHGRILNQQKIPVTPGCTAEELQQTVLKQEHIFFTETLKKIHSGEIKL